MKLFYCAALCVFLQPAFAAISQEKITADKTSGCAPLQINFTVAEETGHLWSWDFSNGQKSTRNQTTATFLQPGVYKIKLLDKGALYQVAEVTVFAAPEVDFQLSKNSVCEDEAITFTDKTQSSTPVVNYVWVFGDGKTVSGSDLISAKHSYKAAGTYDVSLLATDVNGCTANKTMYRSIKTNTRPVANFKPSVVSSCNPTQEVTFTNLSAGGHQPAYTWNFGDKQTSTATNPTHTFVKGKYSIRLSVTDETGCSASASQQVSVTPLNVDFLAEKEMACVGETLRFINASNFKGTGWHWEFSDGTTSSLAAPEKSFSKAGSYSVKFTLTDGNCQQTVDKENMIQVRQGVQASFKSQVSASCNEPARVKLKNNTPHSATVLWNFGDGTKSTKNEAEKEYTQAGNYKITLQVTDSTGCTLTKESEKVIHALKPQVRFTGDTFACAGYQVRFTNFTPNASGFLWSFGDGETSTQKNPFHIYKNNGCYTVSLTAFGDGCDSTVVLQDFVRIDTLHVDFEIVSASAVPVPPFLFSFKNKTASNHLKYLWDFGDGSTDTSAEPVHVYDTPGNFTVRLVAYSKTGCTNSKTISHHINMGTSMEADWR